MISDHAFELILADGVPAVSLATIARRIGVSRQAVSQWVAGRREALMSLVASTYASRWAQWVEERITHHGALALLPTDTEQVSWVRLRLALEEDQRAAPHPAPGFTELRTLERALLQAVHPALAAAGAQGRTDLLLTVLAGLRTALCDLAEPWHPDQARTLFWGGCRRLAGPQADWVSPHAPGGPSASLLARKQAGEGGFSGQH